MNHVNSDKTNKFHRESVEGFDAVLGRMMKVLGNPLFRSYGEALDVSENTIKTWRRRGAVSLKYLEGFSREHNVSLDYLLRGVEVQDESAGGFVPERASYQVNDEPRGRSSSKESVLIHQFNVKGSAGYGTVVYDEQAIGYLEVSRSWVRDVLHAEPGKVDIIKVDGHSMEPTLADGEQVLVDRRCDHFDNDAVYAIQYDGHLKIKRVQIRFDGSVAIKSDNPAYDTEVLTSEQSELLRVIGKVLPWKFGKFKL